MMKTKREVLKTIIKEGCHNIDCSECPYFTQCGNEYYLRNKLARIGAMAILRMFPEKREFDTSRILTCVTVDQAKLHTKGYFADSIKSLRWRFENDEVYELLKVNGEDSLYCFNCGRQDYALFYPIDEEEVEE